MILKNYAPTGHDFWRGRIDDPLDIESFRMHQIIKLIDLKEYDGISVDASKFNACLLGYASDEGIRRNQGRLGAKEGPTGIRNMFASLPIPFCGKTAIYDAGNLECTDHNMESVQEELALAVEFLLDNHLFPIVLGGSHDLSYGHYNGIIKHLKKKTDKPKVGIINFDAHFDNRPYDEQSSSGTMFAQIADDNRGSGIDFNYLCLGIQTSGNTRSLFNTADTTGTKYITATDFLLDEPSAIAKQVEAFIDKVDYVYLTICADVISSASAPGVSATQPFGLKPNNILLYTKQILRSKKVIGFDIAEVSPPLDQDNITSRLAANIIYSVIEILCD